MVRVAVPVDWIRYNKTLGTSSCWRSSSPLLDWLLPICCLCSRSRASQPPLSMLPTPPPAAAGSQLAVGFGMVHGHHRRRCRCSRRLKPQPNRCSTAASEIKGGKRRFTAAEYRFRLRALENARNAYKVARAHRSSAHAHGHVPMLKHACMALLCSRVPVPITVLEYRQGTSLWCLEFVAKLKKEEAAVERTREPLIVDHIFEICYMVVQL